MDVARRVSAAPEGERILIPASTHDDWLSPQELRDLTPQILVDRMRGLRDLAARNAREAERLRRPVDEVWSAIRKTGALYHFVPKRFGGLEFDLTTLIDMVLPISEGCMSTGWIIGFCMEHNYLLANFPLEAQEEIFGEFPYITAPGTLYPPGRAVRTRDGYRLSGRWKWGTGVMHSDWVMVGANVDRDDGVTDFRFFLMPAGQVNVIDTWYVDGMVGTGSNDLMIEDLHVPAHRTMSVVDLRADKGLGRDIHDGWIYRLPMPPFLSLCAAVAPVGGARAAIAHFEASLSGGDVKRIGRAAAHMRLGAARMEVMSAETIIRDVAKQLEGFAKRDVSTTPAERIEARAQICYAVELCRVAVRRISEIAGSSAHTLDNPIQRIRRDLDVVSSHALFDWDGVTEAYGRTRLGLNPNSTVDGS